MLNKAILLNLRIGKKDMDAGLGVILAMMFLYLVTANSLFFPSTIFLLIAVIVYQVFYIKVVNKVCFSSFFDDEGIMYMTLPIPAKTMILGKIFAVSFFETMASFLLLGGIILALFLTGVSFDAFMTAFAVNLPSLQGGQMETTIAFGLIPLSVFVASVFSSALVLTIFLKFGMKKKKLLPCWIVYFLLHGAFNLAIEQMEKLLEDVTFGIVINDCMSLVIYLLLSVLLVRYCVKCLSERYDV